MNLRNFARFGKPDAGWQQAMYRVIFESDTAAGRHFDIALIVAILASLVVVMLDSVASIHVEHAAALLAFEWGFTILFTVEYLARLAAVRHPWRYALSVYGVIDLLAIAPTYLAILVPELHALIDVRVLRLLRVFRIFKLTEYVVEFGILGEALYASRRKIFVFLSFVLTAVFVIGTLMYVIEGPQNGFTSIPTAVYWAITTMTTVGFGDITPKTDLGRLLASIMMLLGWGTLAVPTGIVSAEFTMQRVRGTVPAVRVCSKCLRQGLAPEDKYCRDCGALLADNRAAERP